MKFSAKNKKKKLFREDFAAIEISIDKKSEAVFSLRSLRSLRVYERVSSTILEKFSGNSKISRLDKFCGIPGENPIGYAGVSFSFLE